MLLFTLVFSCSFFSHVPFFFSTEPIEYTQGFPEDSWPFLVFDFHNQDVRTQKGTMMNVSGFDFQKKAHVMDLALDRYKVWIAGEHRNTVVLEIPKVEYPDIHQYDLLDKKRAIIQGTWYDQIAKQEKLARNKMVSRNLQHTFYLEFDESISLTAEYFPAEPTFCPVC